ncbi:hypothetical protein [Blastococcus tunisiensis]|uniref:Uncharacterized protein n=1 Tax=Blastococcus tunisiensis TaxID=1798228 RepID=A0A1I2EM39_9ACTN|nr:hypothetical protein [Blastococcus sp. DSM 46838]SFE93441.1 hypothetical protein SAMN05216574_10798 [Blastococcus sp. DSM 46838]
MTGARSLTSGDLLLGELCRPSWWLVGASDEQRERIVAGPFRDRTDAAWAASTCEPGTASGVRPAHGLPRPDGALATCSTPEDRAWLGHVSAQIDRLPEGWDADVDDEDPLVTLVLEITAALAEAGLPLHDPAGPTGGVCLSPEPVFDAVVVAWRAHDRSSLDQLLGVDTDATVRQIMTRAVWDLLLLRGFAVDRFGSAGSCVVRPG